MLKKGSTGFGIAISEDRQRRLIIRGLNPNGIAQKDGRLQIGDEIIRVNALDVKTMNYDDIMNLLHATQEPVEFCIKRVDPKKGKYSKKVNQHFKDLIIVNVIYTVVE